MKKARIKIEILKIQVYLTRVRALVILHKNQISILSILTIY